MNIRTRLEKLERARSTTNPWEALPRNELRDVCNVLGSIINTREEGAPLPEDLTTLTPGAMAVLREAAGRLQSNNPH